MAQYNDYFDELEERDERRRTREINGMSYTIQATDPYGHWHFVKTHSLPEVLSGSYVTANDAWKAAEAYETSRPKPVERTIISTDGKGNKKRIPQNSVIIKD